MTLPLIVSCRLLASNGRVLRMHAWNRAAAMRWMEMHIHLNAYI